MSHVTFSFDGVDKVISPSNTSSFDISYLYSRWKDWVLDADNSKYQQAFRFVGGDPTVGGKSLGITYFLTNEWVIQPFPANHRLQINGNLFTDAGTSPFIPVSGSFNVIVESSVSNLVDAEILLNDQQRSLEYGGYVYVNSTTGDSGSLYPNGLPSGPSNNIEDALLIANTYGIRKILFQTDSEIKSSLDISNFLIEGNSADIEIQLNNPIANNTRFINIILSGTTQV